jgi:hypothetical protein
MEIDAKMLIKTGALCGAAAAIAGSIWGTIVWADPYVTLPKRVEQTDAKVQQVAITMTQQQQIMRQMYQSQLFLSQQFWTNSLAQAQMQIRQNPNNMAARQQMNAAEQALQGINRQLYGQTP